MIKIPAHIFWPGMILTLLGVAITASFTILYFSTSDGGPQVIPDYYQKSVDYDEYYDARMASIDLGWQIDIHLNGDGEPATMTIVDADDEPLEAIEGTIAFYRPSEAQSLAQSELQPVDGEPGAYTFEDHTYPGSYWDLDLDLIQDDRRFIDRIRTEVSSS